MTTTDRTKTQNQRQDRIAMSYDTGAKHLCDFRDADPANLKVLHLDIKAAIHGEVVMNVLTIGPWCLVIRSLARAGRAGRDAGGLCHALRPPPQRWMR